MLKHIIIISGLVVTVHAGQAQLVKNYKRAADKFYKQGDYYSAARYYEKSLAGNKSAQNTYDPYIIEKKAVGTSTKKGVNPKVELLYNLADSYYKLQDFSHAEPYYKEVIELDEAAYPNALYAYAICLRANGKYNLAQQQLEKFLKTKPAPEYKVKATQELANCNFIQQQLQKGEGNVKIAKLNSQVNKEGASYAAAWMNAGTLVFTATRPSVDEHSKTTEYNNALYIAAQHSGSFEEAQKIAITGNSTHQGVATFTPDGKKMFFTGWNNQADGKKTFAIYSCENNAGSWSPAVLVEGSINVEGTDARQPHVTADGNYLLFSSNRPGGQGGYDIWYAPLKEGRPGKAMNIGSAINTKEDDGAPFYFAAGNTLVFASKGHTGMGGFDLFSSTGSFGSSWSEAVNLGYPVNSVKNDSYFVNRGANLLEDAIISSDRASLCCLELLAVHKSYHQYYTGQLVDCENKTPISGATVTAITAGQPVATQTTNAEGYYMLETEIGKEVRLTAVKDAYKNEALVAASASSDTINVGQSCLTKIPDPFKGQATLVTHDIRFGYNEKEVDSASYGYMNDMVAYLKANPTVKLEIAAHTDGIGSASYNQKLSQDRADACVNYLVNAGIDASRLLAKGYGATMPLEKEKDKKGKDIPAAREKNRRVEFKIIK